MDMVTREQVQKAAMEIGVGLLFTFTYFKLHMSSFCMMSGYLCLNIWATETNYI